MADMIKVTSASDFTVVVNSPATLLVKSWNKKGAFHLIPRDTLMQSFYNCSLEYLVKNGLLVVEDKQFLQDIGLIAEEDLFELTDNIKKKSLSVMPVRELEELIKKMSPHQIEELASYAIANNAELKLDRMELLSKASGKNILKAIELHKAAQED